MTAMTAWRRVRYRLAAVLFVGAALPAVGPLTPVCAAPGTAALVVDLGEEGDVYRYCVELPSSSVSGLELIELASEQHGLQYSFGYGGRAVCQLQGVGPEGDDCFDEMPYFWGYWRGDGNGGWDWSSTGAGSTTVQAGDVEGWSWGTGQDGNTHPQPPATTHASVCGEAPPPKSGGKPGKPKGDAGGSDGSTSGASAGDPADAGESSGPLARPADADKRNDENGNNPNGKQRSRKDRQRAPEADPSAAGDRDPAVAASQAADDAQPAAAQSDGGEPSPVGFAALGAAVVMVGAGVVLGRRRRTG